MTWLLQRSDDQGKTWVTVKTTSTKAGNRTAKDAEVRDYDALS